MCSTRYPRTFSPWTSVSPVEGDEDLTQALGEETNDACSLEFDFELSPGSGEGTLKFNYVFMSEEYNEFVDEFNDGFLLLIDGKNVAKIPGTQDVVSIDNVNDEDNSEFYNDNDLDPFPFSTEYDGFTALLSTSPVKLVPGQSYAAKLVIADAVDDIYDSSIVIQGSSFVNGERNCCRVFAVLNRIWVCISLVQFCSATRLTDKIIGRLSLT